MEENQLKSLAEQLRKPTGEFGVVVGKKMNESNRFMNLKTIEFLNPQSGDVIVEIGMGNGLFVADLLSSSDNIRYIGCDYSSLMIEEAEKNNRRWIEKGVARFVQTDIESMPEDISNCSKIFTVNTMYFWEQPEDVLLMLKKRLKPGGVLVIAIRPKSSMLHYPFVAHGFTLYSQESLEKLLRQVGFKAIEMKVIDEPTSYFQGQPIDSKIVLAKATLTIY